MSASVKGSPPAHDETSGAEDSPPTLLAVQDVALRRLPVEPESVPTSVLVRDGREVATIEGCVLEGAFEAAGGDLLVLATHDCPFEETLDVVLLRGGAVLDRYRLGSWYTPGYVRDLSIVGASLAFEFMGVVFVVTERLAPALVLPGVQPRGVWRKMPFHHRALLKVTRCGE